VWQKAARNGCFLSTKRADMHSTYVREQRLRDSFHWLGAVSVALVLAVGACGNTSDDPGTAAGAGTAGSPVTGDAGGTAGAAGAAGAAGDSETGSGGVAGEADAAGSSGSAGAPVQALTCEPGGTLFTAGKYSDANGNELWLRQGAQASTLALIPSGPANADKLPQLFVVDRVCTTGTALIAKDPSSAFRLDFSLAGTELAVCVSTTVASVDAALLLPAADISHASDTGCQGKPFELFTTEAVAP